MTVNREEIAQLHEQFAKPLKLFVESRINDSEQAADIVHETFVKISYVEHPLTLLEPKNYLYTIARNLISEKSRYLKPCRQHHCTISPLSTISTMSSMSSRESDPIGLGLSPTLQIREFENAVVNLSYRCRQIFYMKIFHRKTFAEIAQSKDMSIAAVEKCLVRSYKICLEIMKDNKASSPGFPHPGKPLPNNVLQLKRL
jgi:RNA polymerase sigma factor (sigma-70 family)